MRERRGATYMVIERFRDGSPEPVYARLRERGRLLPAGLSYVASWVDVELQCCFQVVEAEEPALLDAWTAQWRGLVDFEVHRVVSSDEAVERVQARAAARTSPGREE